MVQANSINAATSGIVGNTGTSFTGTSVTQYNVIVGGATSSTIANVAPSSTSGVPLISQGSSTNPAFGTAVVAGGGTGLTSASQGDLLYGSAANTLSLLAKDTNATRYLSNTGTTNNPAWAQVNLANGVTGTLPNANTTATSANTNSAIVARDGSGNFSAGTITASLTGTASTATVATTVASDNEASDTTCFPLFITDSGTQSLPTKNNANFTYNASSGFLGITGLTLSGYAASGITSIATFSTTVDGNYINIGGGGRNIGRVASTGNLFLSRNLDYNAGTSAFNYNATQSASCVILANAGGTLGYAPSGTAGNAVTPSTAVGWDASGNVSIATGNLTIDTLGKTLKIKQGSNACAGTGAILVGGTVTVSTTAVATGDIVLLSCTAAGGTQGVPRISAISNGTSFTITSSNGADTSTYSWVIIKAA